MEFHEAANLFPLDDEHLDELAEDIRKNGQHVAIEILDGRILDGRRRFLACRKAGRTPETVDVNPDDPVAYVLSLNLHRRHLSPTQLAMVGGRARDLYDKQAKERKKRKGADSVPVSVPEQKGDARDKAGKAVGVGGSLIDRATKVLEKGTPELIAAVDEDRISVSNAAKLADEDAETQRDISAKAKKTGGRYRKVSKPEPTEKKGMGLIRGKEAIDCLKRIPKNDGLRLDGFKLVMRWIKDNR